MIKRPFFGLARPSLKHPVVVNREQDSVEEIPLPQKVTLFLSPHIKIDDIILRAGDKVITGQMISTATGTITGISEYTGYLGQTCQAVSIEAAGDDQWDDEFNERGKTTSPENALEFFNYLPGNPDFQSLLSFQPPVNTIIINGIDKDLLIATNQLVFKTETESLIEGIEHLKKITRASSLFITVPSDLTAEAEKTGVPVHAVNPVYPNILPEIITKNILGRAVPPGKRCEEMGVGFINAEAVVSLTRAFAEGKIPVDKIVTVINKDYIPVNIRARIGTPVKDILKALNIETEHGDQIVLGGPMTGTAIYSEDMPVSPDTDAIMVLDKKRIVLGSGSHCINCGECVRACPARVPVNMLVRLLENGLYEEAAEQYDLLSCIECGLCSYVCVARIPVFHYIMLGKYEFSRIQSAEESNA
ncbi:MAG: 4Fe-4S dicluster domain-containing protein [Deltaproteobacteria bacterium]|nr:4Fe-4S dicluster domain-containing protein [Deltaproteobacteria bacterium]